MRFKGWDFMELCKALGWKSPKKDDPDEEERAIEFVKKRISMAMDAMEDTARPKSEKYSAIRLTKTCRSFVIALVKSSKKMHDEYPLWLGLSRIKHDWTFLRYVSELLGYMWT